VLEESKIELARHRLTTAKEDYLAALDLVKGGHYKVANNRAYYTIFHSMRAILALEGLDFKKHSAVIAYFNQNYIKNGEVDKHFFNIINNASLIRNESDYSDFYIASQEETEELISNAKEFYEVVYKYIEGKIVQSKQI
jgi:uncharacterized protein (UPF0332 family)